MITPIKAIVYLLAAFFIVIGMMKLNRNKKKPNKYIWWVKDFKPVTITFIAFIEVFVAICLVGPSLVRATFLITHYAAIAICLLMVLAGIYHSRKKEYTAFALNALLFLLAMIVAFN